MKHLSFQIEEDDVLSPAVGLIVLQSDETMEHELRQWLPSTVRLFHTRIPNSVEINSDSLQAMQQQLPVVTSLLPRSTAFKVIVYGCTSGSTIIGESVVKEAVQSVFPDAAVTNPLSAVKARLQALEVRRLAILTPYVPDVSKAILTEIESTGINIIRGASFHESRDDRVARISAESLNSAIDELASPNDIDAIFASCTNLRMYDFLSEASQRVGIPVISSNSALAWHIEQLLE